MIELTVEGSYYDIGYFLGQKLSKNQLSYYPDSFSKEQLDFAYECLKVVKQFFPELLDEIQGVVDGSDFDYERLISSEFAWGISNGCTVFAIPSSKTKNGRIIFARSMDWFNEAMPFTSFIRSQPENRLANIGFTETLAGRIGGVNEAGLVIGESNCFWGNFQPGLVSGTIVRWILDNCKTTKEAVNFLDKVPHTIGNNYLLADSNNNIVRVEAYQKTVVITYFQDKFTAIANHYFSEEFDQITPIKPKHSTDRIDYLKNWISKQSNLIDIESVKKLQRIHEVELCPHVQEYYNNRLMELTTSWAWIYELGSNTIHLCEGSPCKEKYKTLKLF